MYIKYLKAAFAGLILSVSGIANASIITYTDSQTFSGNLNFPNVITFNFATPTFAPVTGATLITTSMGDWSYEGVAGALSSSESLSVSLDGNLISNDLFHLNANLDALSPTKNDNSQAIFQTIFIPQVLLSSLVIDGTLSLVYTPRTEVNVSSSSSFLTAQISYDYTDDVASVPEPSTLAIFALGIMGLASRKFKKS
ncbi:PEP-CTERM sorting domain-containing protein [Colwellia sp. RE-S-Sl-9]